MTKLINPRMTLEELEESNYLANLTTNDLITCKAEDIEEYFEVFIVEPSAELKSIGSFTEIKYARIFMNAIENN
jgi:hypothetical protein